MTILRLPPLCSHAQLSYLRLVLPHPHPCPCPPHFIPRARIPLTSPLLPHTPCLSYPTPPTSRDNSHHTPVHCYSTLVPLTPSFSAQCALWGIRGPGFSGALQNIPTLHLTTGRGRKKYRAPHAGPHIIQDPIFPPAFRVPTVFFATGAYFQGQLSIYHTLDHAFIADKHNTAYYKRLIDPGSKHRSRIIWSALQNRAGPCRGALCGASWVVPCMSWGRAGLNLLAPAQHAVRCRAQNLSPAPPRSKQYLHLPTTPLLSTYHIHSHCPLSHMYSPPTHLPHPPPCKSFIR